MKKTSAVIEADVAETPLGTRSRLPDDLLGVPVLRRTVQRVRQAKRVGQIFVLCPPDQADRCRTLLAGTEAVVSPHDGGPSPWRALVQAARKWSLDGWRGGIGGTTYFDEFTDCRVLTALLDSLPADLVLCVPPAAVVFDPILADRMIEHIRTDENESRLAFAQAPPGLAGILLDSRLIRELAEKNTPVGWLFSYKPDNPRKDLIFESCCVPTPVDVRHAGGRLLADTRRSFETLEALLHEVPDPDAEAASRWLRRRESNFLPTLPREVEIELTTDDPYPRTLLRPRGDRVERRGPADVGIVEHVAAELAEYDDSLVVLGGFGDPLRHPDIRAVLNALRPLESKSPCAIPRHTRAAGFSPRDGSDACAAPVHARSLGCTGVYGLAVRTTAANLTDDAIDAVIAHHVDILVVPLDAWTQDLYARLHSPTHPSAADLNAVLLNLDRLAEARERNGSVYPVVVPEFTKTRENVHELDEFYDGWLRKLGAVTISGYSHGAGQLEDRSVIRMAPATRTPCRRIQSRCLILADGRVTTCDQDSNGRQAVGRIERAAGFGPRGESEFESGSLQKLWQNAAFRDVRIAHQQGRFGPTPLCAACDEWHRP